MCFGTGSSDESKSDSEEEEQKLWEETQIFKGLKRRPGEQVGTTFSLDIVYEWVVLVWNGIWPPLLGPSINRSSYETQINQSSQ